MSGERIETAKHLTHYKIQLNVTEVKREYNVRNIDRGRGLSETTIHRQIGINVYNKPVPYKTCVPPKIHISRFSVCLKHVESPFSCFLHRILDYVLYALRAISQENFKMWGNMDPCQRPIFESLTLI